MYTVMEASIPSRIGRYRKVAVVKIVGNNFPRQINMRDRKLLKLVRQWDRLNVGSTDRCAYAKAVVAATELCRKLNFIETAMCKSLIEAGY